MIFLVDRDEWDVIVKFGKGILIIDRHLFFDEDYEWHAVKDLGGKHLLGKIEFNDPLMTSVDKISNSHVSAVHSYSRSDLKRMLLPFAPKWHKEVAPITVINFHILEAERYWCPSCGSINLSLMKANKFWLHWLLRRLKFQCLDCNKFSLQKNESGWQLRSVKNLISHYGPENIRSIPPGQSEVVAVIGRLK
jgi:hypothetical protein